MGVSSEARGRLVAELGLALLRSVPMVEPGEQAPHAISRPAKVTLLFSDSWLWQAGWTLRPRARTPTSVVAATVVPAGLAPHIGELSDLDRDGDVNVVASDHDSVGVSVLLGDGQGHFAAAGSPFAAHGCVPHNHGLAVGNVSGDGIPDVLIRPGFGQLREGTGRADGRRQPSLSPPASRASPSARAA